MTFVIMSIIINYNDHINMEVFIKTVLLLNAVNSKLLKIQT